MGETHRTLLNRLGAFVAGAVSVDDALSEITQQATIDIPAATMAGITMAGGDGRPYTHGATDGIALAIDLAQYRAERGPCLDAWRLGRTVHVEDIRDAAMPYPEFSATALENGVHSTLSLPLFVGGQTMGALNLYAPDAAAFDDDNEAIGSEVAMAVAVIMATVTRYADAIDMNEHLTLAMSSRSVIEQAKGVIMASTRCSPDQAFDILRQQSQAENRKLRDIAMDVVARYPTDG